MARKEVSRPGSDEGRRRILDAARDAFATYGFEGASLRSISSAAGVLHTAMLYHFNTKDALWRAVMADLFEDLEARVARREAQLQGAGRLEVARGLLREFVHFCAEHPELHRIMTIEGRSDTPRLAWLTETYTERLFGAVSAMTPLVDPTVFRSPVELYYAIIGLAASTFTLAPEYRRLSGREPFDPEQVEAVCVLIERLILGVEAGLPVQPAPPQPSS